MTASTVTRSYRLRPGTVAMLDEAVERLGIPQSHLLDALLEHALAAEAAGELVIVRRPVAWELEKIYPAK
jgi:hypothetical protein